MDDDIEIINPKNKKNRFLNKVKNTIHKMIDDAEVETNYKKNAEIFNIYKKNGFIALKVYGYIHENTIEIYGKYDLEIDSIIIRKLSKKAYRLIHFENIELFISGTHNIIKKDGMKLFIKDDLKEVNVIKAGNKYFLNN